MVRKVKREHVLGKTWCIPMLEMFVNMKQPLVMSEVGRQWRRGAKLWAEKDRHYLAGIHLLNTCCVLYLVGRYIKESQTTPVLGS